MWSTRNPHALAAALENSLAVPQKVKYRVTLRPSHSAPMNVLKRIEDEYSSKALCTLVHSSIIHNSQKVETT